MKRIMIYHPLLDQKYHYNYLHGLLTFEKLDCVEDGEQVSALSLISCNAVRAKEQ